MDMRNAQNMIPKNYISPNHIVFTASLVTLLLTPWMNVDSLVVPKLVILFCISSYIFPFILMNKTNLLTIKLLYILLGLTFLQMALSTFMSNSPIEQQIFGRTGRGLGLVTYFSLFVLIIASTKLFKHKDLNRIITGIVLTSLVSSLYSILQKYGFDITDWYTRTNGIIGTIGNPNFQSAFSGMALVPTAIFAYKNKNKSKYFSFILVPISLITIYYTKSTQGYITSFISILSYILIFVWFKNKTVFRLFFSLSIFSIILIVLGIINKGPLAYFLYKASIQSRFEFWRTSWTAALDNPYFGVGIDSLGDYSRVYRSTKDSLGINENFDNAHNYFLEAAATGGFLLVVLNILFIVFTLVMFTKLQTNIGKFDVNSAGIFAIWLAFQSQSLISPGTISLLTWNAVVSGSIFGAALHSQSHKESNLLGNQNSIKPELKFFKPYSYLVLMLSMIIVYPYFKSDKLQYDSFVKSDALLAVQAAKNYPESTVRYNQIGLELLKSNLPEQSLEVAQSAIQFNPNSITAWSLIYMNPKVTESERNRALLEILRLDPNNKQLLAESKKYVVVK
jgi:O-antigen ligase